MSTVINWVFINVLDAPLRDNIDAVRRQGLRGDFSLPINAPENGPALDPRLGVSVFQPQNCVACQVSQDVCLIISGLRTPQTDPH